MTSRNRLVLPIIFSALAILTGCSNSSNTAISPPSGKFSNSNLKGSYTFSAFGTDAVGAPFSLGGILQANGNGGITGGTVDLNDASLSAALTGVAITGGTYTVTADGRGKATLNAGQASVVMDFVLLSNSHALVTRYDGSGAGSGTMDIQSSNVTQAQLAGSYAFNLGGIDANGNPFATVGSFTLDSSGNISSGVEDFNDAGLAYPSLTLTGSVIVGTGSAPGTATLTATNSSSATPFGTLAFDVYAVDATDLKLLEKDASALLGGDAFTQMGASLPSSATAFAFVMGGGVNAPLSVGGLMMIDGVSAISSGSEDINDNGNVPAAALSFNGSYSASGSVGGRTLFNLSSFAGATQLVAYPTAIAGVQILEIDNGGLLDGVAFPQAAGATVASSQGYGLGLAAINIGGISGAFEEDDIAEFATTGSGFSGLIDVNDQGSLSFDQKLNGSYTLDSPATGRGVLTSNAFNGVFYAVDSSTALFLETDTNQVGTGSFQLQTPGASSAAAVSRMAALHLTPAGRNAWRRR